MRKTWLINLTLVCTILGILLSWQYKSYKVETPSATSVLQTNIIEMIQELEQEIKNVEEEISSLRSALTFYDEMGAEDAEKLAFLQDYLHYQRSMAALTPVKGPGLIITLDDNVAGAQSASADFATFRPEDYIIHDKTLLYLVNEIRAAGAQAIAINNQRIVATSNIRCVGTVILVNTTPMAPPYQIKALGNPEQMKEQLSQVGEIVYLKSRNFPVKIEVAEVEIPEYKGSLRRSHIQKGGE